MNRHHTIWALATALALGACATDADLDGATTDNHDSSDGAATPEPSGGMLTNEAAREHARAILANVNVSATNGIPYNGGKIMSGTPTIYFIFYGDWGTISTNTSWNIFQDWANSIGGSPYYGINSTYYDTTGNHVLNAISYGGLWYDRNYSQGKTLTDAKVASIVQSTIDNNQLPSNLNAIYMVLAANDVTDSGTRGSLCTNYCAYHDRGVNGVDLKYAFIGNAGRCLGSCAASFNQSVSPNGNPAADAMVSMMTHELVETVTDPDYDAWSDGNAVNENGDKCNFNFGTTNLLTNGSRTNITLGGRPFLIQQNWLNVNNGSCAMSYPHSTLMFDAGDTRLYTATGDWKVGSYKAECGPMGAVTGLSNSWSTKIAHSVFCTDVPRASATAPLKYPHNACTVVNFTNGDNRRTTVTGDWDQNFVKGECGINEYVAGVSQRTNGFIDSILCCPGNVAHQSCSPRYNWAGDSRESTTNGDWEPSFVKMECGPGRYVAGVARNSRAGQPGGPDALLCCQ